MKNNTFNRAKLNFSYVYAIHNNRILILELMHILFYHTSV